LRTDNGDDFVYADQSLVILPSQIARRALNENLQLPDEVASLEPSGEIASVGSVQIKGSVENQEEEGAKDDEKLTPETKVQHEAVEKPAIEVTEAEILEKDQEETGKVDPSQLEEQETQLELQEALEKSELSENKANISESDSDISVSDNDLEISNSTTNSSTLQPKVVVADSDGVKVLQDDQNAKDQLALDSIAYDPLGNVILSGRSNPDGLVRFYVNNEAISAAKTDDTGYWETDLSDVIPGTYTLRIDELGSRGNVVSRLESPFKREDREKLAALIAPSSSPVRINIVTVQPGNTLWAIARKRYGDGLLYVRVFEANRDKIKDPDLIYPGQLFDLPDLN